MDTKLIRRLALIAAGLAICLTVAVMTLVLTTAAAPHGTVYGTEWLCNRPAIVDNQFLSHQRCEGVPHGQVRFIRIADWPTLTAATDGESSYSLSLTVIATADAYGNYAVSLPVGRYLIPGFFDAGPHQIDVIADKKLRADFEGWRLPQ